MIYWRENLSITSLTSPYDITWIESMLTYVFSVTDHRRRQNVVRTLVTHSAIASCATFPLDLTTFYEDMIDHRSCAQNLSSCEIKAWKKFRPERDLNPWPKRYRCSALLTGLSSHWELGTLWVRNIPVEGEKYKWMYESSYIWSNISTKSARVLSGVPNTEKQMKARGRFGRVLLLFRSVWNAWWNPKHEFLRWLLKLVWKFHGIFSEE